MTRIAIDAMGGDRAPDAIVAGAVEASKDGVDVVLVGDTEQLGPLLTARGVDLPVVHAPDTIGMDEDPSRAVRDKPEASVSVAARLVRSGDVAGFVSAGSTGAALTAAAVMVGRIPGVARPTIATILPTAGTPTIMLDSGANPEVRPEQLVQFAHMGSILSNVYHGVERPRVALLNIGEEKGKGRPVEKAAYELLEASGLNFVGNAEGRDVATDFTDVLVTDGFTGNVLLKAVEGSGKLVADLITEALRDLPAEMIAEIVPRLVPIRNRMDPEHTGGGHLVGIQGVVVIAHGSSGPIGIANALRMARDGADRGLAERIASAVGTDTP